MRMGSENAAPIPARQILIRIVRWVEPTCAIANLTEIVGWLKQNTSVTPPEHVFDVSQAAAAVNFEAERKRIRKFVALS
jgi:hypothetical protein